MKFYNPNSVYKPLFYGTFKKIPGVGGGEQEMDGEPCET